MRPRTRIAAIATALLIAGGMTIAVAPMATAAKPTGQFVQHCLADGQIAVSFDGTGGFRADTQYEMRSRSADGPQGYGHSGSQGTDLASGAFVVDLGASTGRPAIRPGTYTVDVFQLGGNGRPQPATPIMTKKLDVKKCPTPKASFSGTLTAANGTSPLAGALVALEPFVWHKDRSNGLHFGVSSWYQGTDEKAAKKWTARTDSTGRFSFTGLSAGQYGLRVFPSGDRQRCEGALSIYSLDGPGQLSGEDFTLAASAHLTGLRASLRDGVNPSSCDPSPRKEELSAGKPSIDGAAAVGATLTAKPGAWTTGTKFAYQWLADGKKIPGATAKRLTLKKAQSGAIITVKVTGSKKGYVAKSATSKAATDQCRDFLALTVDGTNGNYQNGGNTPWKAEGKWETGVTSKRVAARGIDYPMSATNYDASYKEGVKNIRKKIGNYLDSCPKSKVVMFGFSQGADVVGTYLGEMTLPTDRLVGAALYGDPRFNVEDSSSTGKYVYKLTTGKPQGGMWGPRATFPSKYRGQIVSLCNTGDKICSSANVTGSLTYLAGKHHEHSGYNGTKYSPVKPSSAVDYSVEFLVKLAKHSPRVYNRG